MRSLNIDGYEIQTPIYEILKYLKASLTNGKLRTIKSWHEGEDNIVVTCPHHAGGKEKNPACNIYVGNSTDIPYGYFKCWVCDTRGDFIHFVSECFDSSEDDAKKWLIKNFGNFVGKNKKTQLDEDINIFRKKTKSVKILDKSILSGYESWHPYLQKRGLSREICEKFQIKYDPQYRQLIFPCFNNKGDLIMLPRRAIDTKTFYLDNKVPKPVYCLDFVQNNNYSSAILVEGPIDALTANQYGLVFGIPGIATFGNPSPEQVKAINNSCIKRLFLMFDNDTAGRVYEERLINQLDKRILITKLVLPRNKKDINELSFEEFKNILLEVI